MKFTAVKDKIIEWGTQHITPLYSSLGVLLSIVNTFLYDLYYGIQFYKIYLDSTKCNGWKIVSAITELNT